MLEAASWKSVFKVYAEHPTSALVLAYQLIAVKQALRRGGKGIAVAIADLELAIESLYQHTEFYKIGHKLYRRTIEGTITPTEEELVSKLLKK